MKTEYSHTVILCSRLDLPGGIERAVVNTANLLVDKGHNITLVILDETDKCFYQVNTSIKIIQKPFSFGITINGNIISRKIKLITDILNLKKIIKNIKATHVISTEYPFTAACVLAGIKKDVQLYAWEHHHFGWLTKNRFWAFLCRHTYPRLTGIICLNKVEAAHYIKYAPIFIIPNFIENVSETRSSLNKKTVLSVSWLIHRKGIDLLLKVAKDVLTKYPTWTWKLIGTGEMEEKVKNFIIIEKLEGKLILEPPIDSNLENKYLNSSLFVLSSRSEAFPMVLLEAMAHGVPCISFNCPSGPADIITHNVDGLLVEKENIEKLAEAISFLITNEEMRKKMGEKAVENVKRFRPENIYELWKQLF